MTPIREMIPLPDLGLNMGEVLKGLRESDQPLVVMREGESAAVVLSIGHYERMEYERGLLLSLLRGERDIAAGRTFDLETVLAEADAILAEGRK